VLAAISFDNAKSTIHDPEVGINRHADAKIIRTIRRITIEPSSVIKSSVGGFWVSDRFWGLMNRIVVKFVKHDK
jgi:hypothetical protein